MTALAQYVESRNRLNRIFKSDEIDLDVAADRQRVADSIDSDLSPENLTCDGELSRAKVASKYRNLVKAAAELKALDPNVTFYEYSA